MAIKKFYASADTTISDAYLSNLLTRATSSNMGASDSLEIFSIYGQATTSSLEKSRILIEFPTDAIEASRSAGKLPSSGSVNFYLKLYNVEHPYTLPKNFYVNVAPLSQSFVEGYGVDMESYTDLGFNGSVGEGATWVYAKSGSAWATQGGDTLTEENYSVYFEKGTEDLEVDITSLVEKWISGDIENNGVLVSLSGNYEGGTEESFYTKKFSARGTEFFYKQPCIEARWDSATTDDRGKFYKVNPALSDTDNTMHLYYYNRVGGSLKNVAGNPELIVKFYSDSGYSNLITPEYTSSVTNEVSGIYSVDIRLNTTASTVYDKWFISSSMTGVFSSSFEVLDRDAFNYDVEPNYVINITNLKPVYDTNETVKFKVFSRTYDWSPTIYTVANNTVETKIIENLYYSIFRVEDNYSIIGYSTGSIPYTKVGYDVNGNNFELDLSLLQKDYMYAIKFAIFDGNYLKELRETFKFRTK